MFTLRGVTGAVCDSLQDKLRGTEAWKVRFYQASAQWATRTSSQPNQNFMIHLPFPEVLFHILGVSVIIRSSFCLITILTVNWKPHEQEKESKNPLCQIFQIQFVFTNTVEGKSGENKTFPAVLRLEPLWAAFFFRELAEITVILL